MTGLDITLLIVLVAAFCLLVSPQIRNNAAWSATVTPLASIIGSGFLVSVPLMASAIGVWAVLAVVGLTALAYLMGGAIRYNIRYGEPVFEKEDSRHPAQIIETASQVVLIAAYFISVAYYLVLLSAFGLKLLGWDAPMLGKIIASSLVATICLVGAVRGLKGIEKAEEYTVSANLAAIIALLVALTIFGLALPDSYSWTAAADQNHSFDWHSLRFLMGLLIIVQGFETTRFMGELFSAEMRIKAMKRAQITSALVYLVFFVLMIPLYPFFTSSTDVAGVIDVIKRVSPWLPFIMTAGAIASQFSASVADSIGASGLITDTSRQRMSSRQAYIVIGAVGVTIIWLTDVTSIVTLASRAFALFYALQCTVAVLLAHRKADRTRAVWFAILALAALAVTVFGIPAGG